MPDIQFAPTDGNGVIYVRRESDIPENPDPSIVYMLWDGVDYRNAVRYEVSGGDVGRDSPIVDYTSATLPDAAMFGVGDVVNVDGIINETDGESWLERAYLTSDGKLVGPLGLAIQSRAILGRDRKYGRVFYDGVVTSGQNTLTSATASFTEDDVGSLISITDDNSYTYSFSGTVISITSPTSVVLSANVTFTSSTSSVAIGKDNKNVISALLSYVSGSGSCKNAYIPNGIFLTSQQIVIPNGVRLIGDGVDYGYSTKHLGAGSALILAANLGANNFVVMGTDGGSFSSGKARTSLIDIGIDASNLAAAAVKTLGRRCVLRGSTIWRGTSRALDVSGQNSRIDDCIIGQHNCNDVILVQSGDCKIRDCEIRQGGNSSGTGHQVHVAQPLSDNGNIFNFLFEGNHLWSGFNGLLDVNYKGANICIEALAGKTTAQGGFTITGNTFDGTYGPQILVVNHGSSRLGNIDISSNHFQQTDGFPTATYPLISLAADAGSSVRYVTISGNDVQGSNTAAFTAFISNDGTVAPTHVVTGTNAVSSCTKLYNNITPSKGDISSVLYGTSELKSKSCGSATFSGTGSQTSFVIPHGLSSAPTSVNACAKSSAAVGSMYATYDATNITVTYITAPSSGTNNVILSWSAEI